MTTEEFVQKYTGKRVDANGNTPGEGAYAQCVDIVNIWLVEGLGEKPILWTNATDFLNKTPSDCAMVLNTPSGIPAAGSVVVFHNDLPLYGLNGHVAIIISADTEKMTVFEQNYPKEGTPCQIGTHTYTGCTGWFTKKPMVISPFKYTEDEMTAMRLERDKNWNLYQAEIVKTNQVTDELSVVNKNLTTEKDEHTADLESIAIELNVSADMTKILPAVKAAIGFEDQALQLTKLRQEEGDQYQKNLKEANDKINFLDKQLQDLKGQLATLAYSKPISFVSVAPTPVFPSWVQTIIHYFQRNA